MLLARCARGSPRRARRRIAQSAAELDQNADTVRYLGSLLLREDEVVLCRFEGSAPAVRRIAEGAAIPFERILEAGHSPWARRATGSAGANPEGGAS